MTRVEKLKSLRSLATVLFALSIFLCGAFLADLRLSLPLAVFCSCLLGSVQGAAAVGLSAIAFFAVNGANLTLMTEEYIGLFAGALASGLIARRPSMLEPGGKRFARCLLGALLAAAIYFAADAIIARDTSFIPYIPLDAVKTAAAAVVGATLRPKAARLLFPPDAEEEEMQEAIEKLKKKRAPSAPSKPEKPSSPSSSSNGKRAARTKSRAKR